MKYDVYEWHLGAKGLMHTDMEAEDVMELPYQYIKFDKEKGYAWVSNCCNFKMH